MVVVAVNCVPPNRYTPALAIWISRDLAWGCGGKRVLIHSHGSTVGRTERKATEMWCSYHGSVTFGKLIATARSQT